MAAHDVAVKKYVVRRSAEERDTLEALIGKGKSPAQRLTKARILLKADQSEDGEGWSDSKIVEALDTTEAMVYRVRKQLVEEGLEAVLSRKKRETPPIAPIFDGEKEAKLIAFAWRLLRCQGRLALLNRHRPRQAQAPLPCHLDESGD